MQARPLCLSCLVSPPLQTRQVASMCAGNVVNTNVPCCGMAGDRGLRYPELTAASLQVRRGHTPVPRHACRASR
jgi:Fe-S oxidoreductase